MCGRAGTLLSFVPASRFHLERGADATTDYLFNKHVIHHLFCSTCGIKSFAQGTGPNGEPTVAVNVRCLDGFEPGSVPGARVRRPESVSLVLLGCGWADAPQHRARAARP